VIGLTTEMQIRTEERLDFSAPEKRT